MTRTTGSEPVGVAPFVAVSHLSVPEAGRAALVAAFRERLGAVDAWPGFQQLQVWANPTDPTALVMVSWWDTEAAFTSYSAPTTTAGRTPVYRTGPTGPDPGISAATR